MGESNLAPPCTCRKASASGLLRRTFVLVLGFLAWAVSTQAAPPAELQNLADRAIQDFRDTIEPPLARLPYLCISEREEGLPMREYVLGSYAAAMRSLLEKAGTPAGERRATQILRSIEHGASSLDMDRWFAETAAVDAQASRHAAAQGELPAALARRMLGSCGANFVGRIGRDIQPLGDLAESDYRRAAALAPADPWNWLVLAWLAAERGDGDLERSLIAARARGDAEGRRVEMLAMLQLGHLRNLQGRQPEAEAALKEAVGLATQAVDGAHNGPAEVQRLATRDLGHALNVLGLFQYRSGQLPAARATLEMALPLRHRLVQEAPEQLALHIDHIATLQHLALVADAAAKANPGDATDAGATYGAQAFALYQALYTQQPYRPMLGKSAWTGMAASALLFAALATLALGLVLLRGFRRSVARWMMAASTAAGQAAPAPAEGPRAAARLAIRRVAAGTPPTPLSSALFQAANATHWRATWTHLGAGLSFGLLAALLWLWSSDTDLGFNRLAILTWSWAWPTALVLGLIWAGDRRRQGLMVAGYFAVLLLLCLRVALGETPPMAMAGVTVPPFFQGLLFWFNVALPTAILLLFLNRSVRSIGPPLLAMMLTVAVGGSLAMVGASTPAGLEAASKLFFRLSLPETFWMPAIALVGAAAFAPLAWWVATRLRVLHAAKWINDQSMVIDAIWLFQALMLCQEMAMERGALALAGLACFVVVKLVVLLGMGPAVRATRTRAPARLLLLRTFRRQKSSERLFDLLGTRWRYAGPITLIAAPDLASSTIDPDEFLDFLTGKLGQRFIVDPATLPQRLQAIDEAADPDGRYRVTELYCGSDVWQGAVRGLMARSDLVAMDLRGFSRSNQGCVFEVATLLDLVPAQRMAFLVDGTTDQAFLDETLAAHLQRLAAHSPNAAAPTGNALTLLDAGSGETFAVGHLLAMADALAANSPPPELSPR